MGLTQKIGEMLNNSDQSLYTLTDKPKTTIKCMVRERKYALILCMILCFGLDTDPKVAMQKDLCLYVGAWGLKYHDRKGIQTEKGE